MATNIYDALAGQSALDIFHEGAYPTGDPETRGGMYSRAKGYGGLIHLVNQYLDNQGLEPTQENYDMAFRAFGAGAPVPVAAKVPEGESAMTSYFDRLLGRTPETKKKTETIKEIMLEDDGEDPDLGWEPDPMPDPTDWIDTIIDKGELPASISGRYDLRPELSHGELLGIIGGMRGAADDTLGAAKEREQKVLESWYGQEIIDKADKAWKEKGFDFSLGNIVNTLGQLSFGISDPASRISDPEYMALVDEINATSLYGPDFFGELPEGLTREDFPGSDPASWTKEDRDWEGDINLGMTQAERDERKQVDAITLPEYHVQTAISDFAAGRMGSNQYNWIMEQYDRDSDTGEPNEPTGDMTGKTGSELVDLISDIGLWGPDDPSAYDPSDLHSDLEKALGHGDPIAAALGPAGYGMTQADIDKAAAALGKGYEAEQKELDKRSDESRDRDWSAGSPDQDDKDPGFEMEEEYI